MTSITMDTHRIVKRFKDAGFTEPQAELITDVIRESSDENLEDLATKQDIKDVRTEIKEVRNEIKDLELRMTIKVGQMLFIASGAVIGAIITAMRFMLPH